MQSTADDFASLLYESLNALPITDVLSLQQHVQDICAADDITRQWEAMLAREHARIDKTPLAEAIHVRALSRFWVFGAFEFLRTWMQLTSNLLALASTLERRKSRGESAEARDAVLDDFLAQAKAAPVFSEDPHFAELLRRIGQKDSVLRLSIEEARVRVAPVFRRFGAIRVKLAKHEFPGKPKTRMFDAGYARIDRMSGSLFFFSETSDDETLVLSRQDLACELVGLSFSWQFNQDRAGRFRWRINGPNGKARLRSGGGFRSQEDCNDDAQARGWRGGPA